MKHKVQVGILFQFDLDLDKTSEGAHHMFKLQLINSIIHKTIEAILPEGWLMSVRTTWIDGKKVDNRYE